MRLLGEGDQNVAQLKNNQRQVFHRGEEFEQVFFLQSRNIGQETLWNHLYFRFLVFFVGLLLTEMTVSTVVSMTLGFEYRREQDVEET